MEEGRIHLLRHGETTGGSSVRFFGSTDIPLSDLGRDQIQKHRTFLDSRPLRAIYTSEMLRARQSAEIVLDDRFSQALPYAPFNEVHFGALEGKTEEEIRLQMPEYWKSWRVEKKAMDYPDGESFEGFRQRVFDGAAALESRSGFPNETLVVAHRGVIRHLLGYFLKIDTQESGRLAPELGQLLSLRGIEGRWELENLRP